MPAPAAMLASNASPVTAITVPKRLLTLHAERGRARVAVGHIGVSPQSPPWKEFSIAMITQIENPGKAGSCELVLRQQSVRALVAEQTSDTAPDRGIVDFACGN